MPDKQITGLDALDGRGGGDRNNKSRNPFCSIAQIWVCLTENLLFHKNIIPQKEINFIKLLPWITEVFHGGAI